MRTEYQEQLKTAARFLMENDHFLIVSHVHPDGDTLSSSLGLGLILQKLNKSFSLVNQDPLPLKFSYLPLFQSVRSVEEIAVKYANVITVDVADQSRAGEISSLLIDDVQLLNIDHHPTNDHFGQVNLVFPDAAATAEVIFYLAVELNVPLDKEIATCIYTGLLTDTGGFRYSNTSSSVLRIASELLEYGISPGDIAEMALETITESHIKLLNIALNRLEIIEHGNVAWTTLNHQELSRGSDAEDSEGIVNYCRNIEGVEIGIFFKETSLGEVKVSLRSKKRLDVGAIAKDFGGGGHKRAAGYTFYGTIEAAKTNLIEKIRSIPL